MDSKMKERIERMAYLTWEAIGGDILTCLVEQEMTPLMKRDDVIESVCDAGYMKMYGKDEEAYNVWNKLPDYDAKMDAVRGAFTFKQYGY